MSCSTLPCSSPECERTVVLADLLSRRAGHRRATRAKSFAAKRVAYVLELAGSCMMIAVFLAMALFL
jgi:hypothetical protein